MARGTEHIVGGVAIWLISVYCLQKYISSVYLLVILLICAISGSLFPDVDVKSKGQKFFYTIMAPGYIVLFAQGLYALCFIVGLCALMPLLCTHRGLFHRWWFIITFASLWGLALVQLFPHCIDRITLGIIFFILGSLSHLWLDFGLARMFVR